MNAVVQLVDLHPLVRLRSFDRWHLGTVRLVARHRLFVNVWLQALVEVVRADARNDDGHEKQDDGENGKCCQRLPGGLVIFLAIQIRNIHANELEEEVGERNEVDNDTAYHACNRFAADPEGSSEEQEEGDDQRKGSEDLFNHGCLLDDDKELDCESQEEEEVELEQGNVDLVDVRADDAQMSGLLYLICEVTPLQP